MTPQQIAALERRVADLERRLPRGTGISTAFGATEVRTMQSGFPVELTSTFDATTGYSWEQRVLDYDTSEVVNVDDPKTGAYAFTPDNDETLSVGDYGWLEPAPEAGGWILLRPGAGGGGDTTLLCEVTVSANNNHTVKQKTWNGSAIADVSGPVTYTQCRSTTATALPVGTLVSMDPIPDASGNYWITPVAYATGTLPGLVSASTQTFGGDKTFTHTVTIQDTTNSGTSLQTDSAIDCDGSIDVAYAVTVNSDLNSGVVFRIGDPFQTNAVEYTSSASYTDTNDRLLKIFSVSSGNGQIRLSGLINFLGGLADAASIPVHSLYYSTTAGKLVYKDGGGTVNNLY